MLDPLLSAWLFPALTAAAIIVGCYVLEVVLPAGPDPGIMSRLEDFLLFLLNTALLIAAGPLLNMAVLGIPSLRLLEGLDAIGQSSPILRQVLSTVIYALVWDFFQYWTHRAEHRIPFLWRFHRTHHDGHAMSSSTALRQSLGAGFIGFFCIHLPTICILGYAGLPYIGSIVLFSAWGYFNHANLKIATPVLDGVISGPRVHHLHHAQDPRLYSCNLAAFFTFYDRLFGTFVRPHAWVSTLPPDSGHLDVKRFVKAWLAGPWAVPNASEARSG